MSRRGGIATIFVVALAGCAGFEHLTPSALPGAGQYPDANAVILDDDIEVRFDSDAVSGKLVIDETVHLRARILREGGAGRAHVVVPYDPAFSSITSFAARTVSAAGKEHVYGWSDGVDGPRFAGFALYSDARALDLAMSPDTPGTVVEYRFTRRYHDWRMAGFGQHFDGRDPERRARLVVIAPTGWKIEAEARRGGQPAELEHTTTEDRGLTTRVWEQHDLPALREETMSGGADDGLEVAVRLASWTEHGTEVHAPPDLRGLSAWLYQLTQPPPSSGAPAELAHELVRGLPDDETARARRLYAWVRDHVSYCAIEIGLGGWQPHAAGETFRHRYGDCKDKANLLREMFAAVGGKSDLVVLYSHAGFPEPLDVVTRRTNHAILQLHLPGGDVLADPTSPVTPLGALPLGDQEADVLPVTAAGAALRRAPSSSAEDNTRELDVELTPRDGELVGTFRAALRGAWADLGRAGLMRARHDDQAKPLGELLGLGLREIAAWAIDRLTPPEAPTPLAAKGALRYEHGWPQTSVRVVSLANLVGSRVPALPGGARREPLVLPCRERAVDHVRIALDDTAELSLPPPTIIERPYGRYELRWERAGGKLTITRTLVLGEHIFPAGAYGDVKGFFDEILAADARAITIRRSAL